MKLSTAINQTRNIVAQVAFHGITAEVKISKSVAKNLLSDWLDTEDFEGDLNWTDEQDYTVASLLDGWLYIGN